VAGIGRLLIQSISFRDYPTVQGCVLLIAVTYVGVNLITDLDVRLPRSAHSGGSAVIKVGAAIVLLTVIGAIVAPWAVPYDPAGQELALRLERPSLQHPFGLDELGRDIFSRVLAGARISLFVGLTVVGISSVVGVLLGSIAGYFGGWLDDVISRTIDVLLAFPESSWRSRWWRCSAQACRTS
jgi:ABC-type dipeptide/oligopeptide/nickel transport system permease subunit